MLGLLIGIGLVAAMGAVSHRAILLANSILR
jgi:hypothetical protein